MKADSFEIVDEHNKRMTVQVCEKPEQSYPIVQSPNDTANMFPMLRSQVRAQFEDVPAMGYRTFFVKPVKKLRARRVKSMMTGPRSMENEFITVKINGNGNAGRYRQNDRQGVRRAWLFLRSSEIGNPWEHHTVSQESAYTTLNEKAAVTLLRDGELETAFRVTINWALPEGRTKDDKMRSEHMKPYTIVNTITLRRDQQWVEIVTNIDNTVEDHYLQVAFPTNIKSDKVMAQGQFDVIERSVILPDPSLFDEKIQTEQPMNSFVDISDGQHGFALLNEGLKAYEAKDDAARTISLTMLRCFPLRIV